MTAKEETIEFEGEVTEALRNGMFRIRLDNGHDTLGYTAGKMRRFRIRIMLGDRVEGEASAVAAEHAKLARDLKAQGRRAVVLSGGELAAMVLLDSVVRLLPGVMGAAESAEEESFSAGLLEYPHFTRPAEWAGRSVPDVLLSGHHAAVAAWRRVESERITQQRRPDLWAAHISGLSKVPAELKGQPA